MREFFILVYKELLHIFRNRGLLIFLVYAFTIDVYLTAVGIELTLKNAKFFAEDYDNSNYSRELISKFTEPYFSFQGYIYDEELIEKLLLEDKALGVLRIPSDFEEKVKERKDVRIGLIVNGSEATLSTLFSGYATKIISNYFLEKYGIEELPLELRKRKFFNQNSESKYFMGVSELLTVLTLISVVLPAATIIKEKEEGTIETIYVSPVSIYKFLFAKAFSSSIVIFAFSSFSSIFVIEYILQIPFRGNHLTFFLLTFIYLLTTTGLGMFIASFSKNMLQTVQLTFLVLLPMLYLSGNWTPVESMPKFFQYLSLFMPLRFYVDSVMAVIFKGVGIQDLVVNIIALLIIGTFVFLAGSHILSKRI